MSIEHKIAHALNSVLSMADAKIVRKSEIEGFQEAYRKISFIQENQCDFEDRIGLKQTLDNLTNLPNGAEDYLQRSNRRLKGLIKEYSSFGIPAKDHVYWSEDHIPPQLLKYFRGEIYLFQTRDLNTEINYLLTAEYVKSIDDLGIFDILEEDDLFGIEFYKSIDDKIISRDLLDSIVEIYFLEKSLNISELPNVSILDIGAGYGRLAHRMVTSLPNIDKVFCTDAIATSTFISEYYLRFRNVDNKALVVPIYGIENVLKNNTIDLAINIHSFCECSLAAVEWWLDLIRKYEIKYIMIVPNDEEHVEKMFSYPEENGMSHDFVPLLKDRGYRLVFESPKYRIPAIQKYGVSPKYHYLFELML